MFFVKHIDDLARKLISGLTRSIWGCLSRSKHPLFRLSTVGFRTSIKSWEWSSSWGLIASWQNLSTLLAWNSYVKHETGYLDDLALYYFSYPFGLRWSQLTHFCCRVWPAGKGQRPMHQCQMALAPWPSSGNMLEGGQDDSIPWKPETTPLPYSWLGNLKKPTWEGNVADSMQLQRNLVALHSLRLSRESGTASELTGTLWYAGRWKHWPFGRDLPRKHVECWGCEVEPEDWQSEGRWCGLETSPKSG